MSASILVITNVADVPLATDLIHDRWFSLDDIGFSGARRVCILYADESTFDRRSTASLKNNRAAQMLVINDVESMVLEDTERVGWYDFSRLDYDESSGSLSIKTNIPLRFNLKVSRINIAIIGSASET